MDHVLWLESTRPSFSNHLKTFETGFYLDASRKRIYIIIIVTSASKHPVHKVLNSWAPSPRPQALEKLGSRSRAVRISWPWSAGRWPLPAIQQSWLESGSYALGQLSPGSEAVLTSLLPDVFFHWGPLLRLCCPCFSLNRLRGLDVCVPQTLGQVLWRLGHRDHAPAKEILRGHP